MFGVRSLLWLLSAVEEVKTTRSEQNSAEKTQGEREKGKRFGQDAEYAVLHL